MSNFLSPQEIKEYTVKIGITKAENSFIKSFFLSFLGGMFIALAAIGSMIATYTIKNPSIAATAAGIVFSTGLMMVVIAGADLFTGNVLIILSVYQKKVSFKKMLVNWANTFLGNLCGAMAIVILIQYSGILLKGEGQLLNMVISKAAHKMEYNFSEAFILGILCNLLVCLAVWMMYSAKDTGGKVLACIFPIMLFILSGYEHIVANMYYIPAGILAATNPKYVMLSGVSPGMLSHFNLEGIIHNFIPVTLGNLVGGIIIGTIYAVIFRSRNKAEEVGFIRRKAS